MVKITVAIDSKTLKGIDEVRGIGFHTENLIKSLREIKELEVNLVDSQKEDLSKYDLVHFQKFHPFFFSFPFFKKTKSVITIHDLIYLIYPEHYPSGLKGRIRYLIQKILIKKMDAVITISETSKKDICRFLGLRPEKVYVTYLAPRKIFHQISDTTLLSSIIAKYKLPKKFALYVGDVNYNKNIPTLIKACKAVNIPLVICGKQAKKIERENLNHPELKHLKPVIKDFLGKDMVVRLGFVSDNDLNAIYNLASLYVQPSYYEGFGLPVLESMACGCPVIASKINSIVEIAGDAVYYFDPRDANDLAKKINLLLHSNELRASLIKKGNLIVKNYSWERCAKETYIVYRELLK
jgi:glycosyltransferase involved in cell wall biosynthesis